MACLMDLKACSCSGSYAYCTLSFNKARSGSSNADEFGINLARYVTIPTNERSACLFVGGASLTFVLSGCKPSGVSIFP